MKYRNITTGTFRERPNRFKAIVDIDGKEEVCHVKNTGRCREILTEGAKVVLSRSDDPARKTKYDLIAAYKNGMLINIDSQAPNKAFQEFIGNSDFIPGLIHSRPEFTYGDSRFDFMAESKEGKILIEVKGVTLEKDGSTMFPDAPTERGLKHVRELTAALDDGYRSFLVFIIQMKGVTDFTPNYEMHREFGDAVREARDKGVNVFAFDCIVTEDSMRVDEPVKIIL